MPPQPSRTSKLGDAQMKDDIQKPLSNLSHSNNRSLVSHLVDIQNCQEKELRSFQHIETVDCLKIVDNHTISKSQKPRNQLQRCQILLVDGSFVAISYRCNDDLPKEAYLIPAAQNWEERRNEAPNIIIHRVIRYLKRFKLSAFWIDKDCINQKSCVAQARAMNSMDLIYRRSKNPVGVLTTYISKQSHINLLQNLLRGEFVTTRNGYPQLAPVVGFWKARKILAFLAFLMEDQWWTRRWIFQEEYCGSNRMHLLIPHRNTLLKDCTLLNSIRGEVLIKAIEFREHVTMFCIAYHTSDFLRSEKDRKIWEKVLQEAKTYKILRKYSRVFRDDSLGRAMSVRVLEDITHRYIEKPEDTLAIVANCCGYNVRLNPSQLRETRKSLSAAIIALYLLNGEILWNDNRCVHSKDVVQVLEDMSFNRFYPPRKVKALTFMKKFRFVDVGLTNTGIRTVGYLWRVQKEVKITSIRFKHLKKLNNNGKRVCLHRLASVLADDYPQLSDHLRQCATGNIPEPLKRRDLNDVFEAMVSALCEGVCAQRPFIVANLVNFPQKWAIFTRSRIHEDRPQFVFTAFERAIYSYIVRKNRSPAKWVSLMVSTKDSISNMPELLVKGWINGLWFPDDVAAMKVNFPWPAAFKEISPP